MKSIVEGIRIFLAVAMPYFRSEDRVRGRLLLAADDLAAGRLVQPFDVSMPNDFSYWLVYSRASAGRPEVAAFRAWLLAEARSGA